MAVRGTIVAGSLSDRVLGYLKHHPGGWPVAQIAAYIGANSKATRISLGNLCGSQRARRVGGWPALYEYNPAVEITQRPTGKIVAEIAAAFPLYALRASPIAGACQPIPRPGGMPVSARNALLLLRFDGQSQRPERRVPLASSIAKQAAAKRGANASPWRRGKAV
jgi:hypothetical protein